MYPILLMFYNLLPLLLVAGQIPVWGCLSNATVIIFMQIAFSFCNISLGWIPSSDIAESMNTAVCRTLVAGTFWNEGLPGLSEPSLRLYKA